MNAAEDNFTPTTEQVRDGFAHSYLGDGSEIDPESVVADQLLEFDRWLTTHDAAVRDAGLEEAAGIADLVRLNAEQFGYDGVTEAATAGILADSIRDAKTEKAEIPDTPIDPVAAGATTEGTTRS